MGNSISTRHFGRLLAGAWLIATSGSVPALAHPGHGDGGGGPVHYVTEPIHAVGWWGAFAAVVGALVLWRVLSSAAGTREL